MRQQKKLFFILLGIIILSAMGSVLVNFIWLHSVDRKVSYIGLDLPVEKAQHSSIQQGAQLFLDEFNQSNQLKARLFKLKPVLKSSENQLNDLLAVIANQDSDGIKARVNLYQKKSLAVINNASTFGKLTQDYAWLYSNMFDSEHQAKFMANYTRNVLGKKIVTLIYADSEQARMMSKQFTQVYARFGTKIHYTHAFNPLQAASSITALIDEIKEKKDLGMIVILASASHSAQLVAKARDAGLKNLLVGTDSVATDEFRQALRHFAKNTEEIERYSNKLVLFAPLLFDTAGMYEQNFKNNYRQRYGVKPDWLAAYGYDSAKLIIKAIIKSKEESIEEQQKTIQAYLNSLTTEKKQVSGASGKIHFNQQGQRKIHVQVGLYDGLNIIVAPTQLQPIRKNSTVNFIEELKQGKVLYVNDRFMYKTNVIYTGIEMHAIDKVDFDNNTVDLDFSIWFRYKGKFDPTHVMFLNAEVGTIKFGKPVEKFYKKGVTYELYDIKGEFNLDYSTEKRRYGTHLLGINFHHQILNSNNVIYVADVLGMEFNESIGLKEKLYHNVASHPPEGWKIDKAWLSQSNKRNATYGSPAYVGYAAIPSLYSQVDYGILIKEDRFDFHDFIPADFFVYIGIFGLIGSLFAYLIDKKLRGVFWLMSSWLMRIAFWPLVLISTTNVCIDLALEHNMPIHYLEYMILGFESWQYLLVATLIVIALERFIWDPLEAKTGNKVPALIHYCADGLIYVFAGFAIVAFVFEQSLSSLLATSGVLAMIIGLAVQGNVANIFSGILISIEKPFGIGDWIKINEFNNVKIIDMTWRTMRVQDLLNNTISIPNGKVADSQVVNYSSDYTAIEIVLHLSSKYPPEFIIENVRLALLTMDDIHDVMPTEHVLNKIDEFYAEYYVFFMIDDYAKQDGLKNVAWLAIYEQFTKAGISFDIYYDFDSNNNLNERHGSERAIEAEISFSADIHKRRNND